MGRPARIDTAIAAALTLVSGAELVWRAPPAPPVVRAAGTVLVAALLVVPVAGWRSWPVTASVMIACVGPILLLTQVPIDGVPIAGSVALAVVSLGAGDRLSRRRALVALVILLIGVQGALALVDDGSPIPTYLIVGPWLVGRAVRRRRELTEQLRRVGAELDVERQRYRSLAVVRERRRVAHDLHDSVGHAMSLIVVQARAARHLADRQPEQARESLAAIHGVALRADAELHQLQRVVAAGLSDGPQAEALPALLDGAEAAGLQVTITGTALLANLRPSVAQLAHRVIRESLTNIVRYAPGADVIIDLHVSGQLAVTVTNGPPAAPPVSLPSTGTGLVALREAVETAGGTLRTGSTGEGWVVAARLALAGPSPDKQSN